MLEKVNRGVISITLLLVIINILTFHGQMNKEYLYTSGELYSDRETSYFTNLFTDTDDELIQYFIPKKNFLKEVQIRFAKNNMELDDSIWALDFLMYDAQDHLIYEEQINADAFENWYDYIFEINQPVIVGQEYKIVMHQNVKREDQLSVYCFIAPEAAEESIRCTFNGEPIEGNIEIAYHYNYVDMKPFIIIIVGDVLILMIVWKLYHKENKVFLCKKQNFILWFITPPFMFLQSQLIVSGGFNVEAGYILKNLLIFYVVLCIFTFFSRKVKSSIIVYGCFIIVLSLVDYYVTLFRGTSFMLLDIFNIGTATAVVSSYKFDLPIRVGIYLQIFLLFIIVQNRYQRKQFSEKKRNVLYRYAGGILTVVLVIGIAAEGKNFMAAETAELWDINRGYSQKGFLYQLFLQSQLLLVEKPEGYSEASIDEIVNSVVVKETGENSPENLIVIMNESLADLSVIGELQTKQELMPFLKEIDGNVCKGYLYVPVFGGGTSETEYEVLTGNTKQFLPAGSISYQMYHNDPEFGLAYTLKEEGYKTIALHPYIRNNWNRERVYKEMGFDEFISQENWEMKLENLRWCASDESTYKKIISLYENKDANEKVFTFCVTMQNHGGYSEESSFDFKNTVSLDYEEAYPLTETYLSAINESDKAFQNLIEYFEKVDENTMIVMFGDHQPAIEDEFYECVFGKELEELSSEELQKRYITPYVIWANYDLEAETQDMSSNYFGSYILEKAGIDMPMYNQFLLDLKEELPVIGMGAICDKNREWYNFNQDMPSEYAELLNEYRILQYNNIFDVKNREVDIFS